MHVAPRPSKGIRCCLRMPEPAPLAFFAPVDPPSRSRCRSMWCWCSALLARKPFTLDNLVWHLMALRISSGRCCARARTCWLSPKVLCGSSWPRGSSDDRHRAQPLLVAWHSPLSGTPSAPCLCSCACTLSWALASHCSEAAATGPFCAHKRYCV